MSSCLQLSIHVLDITLIFLLLKVLLEPVNEIPNIRKLLVVEVKPRTLDLDNFSDGLLFLVHVDQQKILRVVLRNTEVVINMTTVTTHVLLDRVLDLFNSSYINVKVRSRNLRLEVTS
jgi:hypothetical protein